MESRENAASSKKTSSKPVKWRDESKELYEAGRQTGTVQRARQDPRTLTPGDALQLQLTIGNRAAAKILDITSQSPPDQLMIQRVASDVPRNNDVELTGVFGILSAWLEIVNGWPPSDTKTQYISQIDGIKGQIQSVVGQPAKWPFKRFGKVTHGGQVYLVFQYTVEGTSLKLDGIVKNPNARDIANKTQNTALNQEAHDFLGGKVAAGKLKLEADTEGLVETYYGYGYRLLPDYFDGLTRPEGIVEARWGEIVTEGRPTREERTEIARKIKVAMKLRDTQGRWGMVNT